MSAKSSATQRPCGHCGKAKTEEGHDGCLGTLPGDVMNACCGHGALNCAYVQYWDGVWLGGLAAIKAMETGKPKIAFVVMDDHQIYFDGETYRYRGDVTSSDRPCSHCGRPQTTEGHMSCGGPGRLETSIQYSDGTILRGDWIQWKIDPRP